jgi:hypothetical protein
LKTIENKYKWLVALAITSGGFYNFVAGTDVPK